MLRMRKTSIIVAVAFGMVLAACGGDSAEPTTTAAEATTTAAPGATTAAPSGTPAPTTAPPDTEPPSDGDDVGDGVATVTVGDTTYEYEVAASIVGRCDPDFFGAFWVIAGSADGTNGGLEMFIIPEGNTNHDETSKVKVNAKDSDERDWRADADGGEGTPEGESSVDSFEIDGNTVTGTASFVDIYLGDSATAEGTFTATCP